MKKRFTFLVSLALHGVVFGGIFGANFYLSNLSIAPDPMTHPAPNMMTFECCPDPFIKPVKTHDRIKKPSATLSVSPQMPVPIHDPQSHAVPDLVADPDNLTPPYPEWARQLDLEQSFIVSLTIDTRGHVSELIFLQGQDASPAFKAAIQACLLSWKFHWKKPSVSPVKIIIPINFKLE